MKHNFIEFCNRSATNSTTVASKIARRSIGLGLAAIQIFLVADAFAQASERGAYQMPYTRYEADIAARSANTQIMQTTNFDIATTASEASEQKYINLPVPNSSIEWTVNTAGNGVTVRYTMPDSADGEGLNGSIDIYVNGQFDQTVPITSHYAWQYYVHQEPENTPVPFANSDYIAMRFDETHFLLKTAVKAGDKIRIQKNTNDNLAYGIDFIELEPVPAQLTKPAGYVSIADFGATPNDSVSDLTAFNSALAAAGAAGTGVYLPAGKWDFNNKVVLTTSNIGIKGAGMWYTEIYYSNPAKFSGGMLSRVTNVEISDIYFNTINNKRFAQPGDYMIYKAFMGTYGANSKFRNVWAEHFEVGAWLGGYDAPYPVDVTSNLLIS
ncbi:MAG: carbohydrate-binding protein, partial [Chitinophagaceae bacterium]